jgi:hypothetical protein
LARHNKPLPDVGFWDERDLQLAREWKEAGFAFKDIAKALGRDAMQVQMKWRLDMFSLVVKPKVQRKCLSCQATFYSEGAHNRRCDGCREKSNTSASVVEEG